jgi:hypothetical protein
MNTDLLGRPSQADTGQRNDHDFYETPRFMVASLLALQPMRPGSTILEPAAGDGAISRVLARAGHCVITNDVDRRHEGRHFYHDATAPELWGLDEVAGVEWVIGNLPFSVAFPILQHAHALATVGVALLLRKSFLEPTKERGTWLEANPPDRTIVLPRHSFRGKGSDSVSTDWFIWLKQPSTARAIVVDAGAKGRI